MQKKIFIILDSASRSNIQTDNSFIWYITSVSTDNNFLSGRILVPDELSNITKIEIKYMDVPISPLLEPVNNTIRCYMQLVPKSIYFSDLDDNFIPFHFEMTVKYNKRCRRLILTPVISEIKFDRPLSSIQTIQMKLYDPYLTYKLPLDYSICTISNGPPLYSTYTLFTITSGDTHIPINTGDNITVVTPITTPSIPYNTELLPLHTHNIIKLTTTTFLIYTVNPVPIFSQTNVYVSYSTNRFSIALDITYEGKQLTSLM